MNFNSFSSFPYVIPFYLSTNGFLKSVFGTWVLWLGSERPPKVHFVKGWWALLLCSVAAKRLASRPQTDCDPKMNLSSSCFSQVFGHSKEKVTHTMGFRNASSEWTVRCDSGWDVNCLSWNGVWEDLSKPCMLPPKDATSLPDSTDRHDLTTENHCTQWLIVMVHI